MIIRFQVFFAFSAIGVLALLITAGAVADDAVSINYGTVESVSTVDEDERHAGGALAGGLLVGLASGPRHKALKVAAGAAAGGAIQGAATSGTYQQYTIDLVSGGQERVSTEQDDIRVGDCVSVEQGDNTNIRRVGATFCDGTQDGDSPDHHKQAASACDKAKSELTAAERGDSWFERIPKVELHLHLVDAAFFRTLLDIFCRRRQIVITGSIAEG